MYILALVLLLSPGIYYLLKAYASGERKLVFKGLLLLLPGAFIFSLMSVWAEFLWFQNLGYASRFLRLIGIQISAVLIGGAIAGATGFGLSLFSGPHLRSFVTWVSVVGGCIFGLANSTEMILFLHGVDGGVVEPILGQDVSFYMFGLPLLVNFFWLMLFVSMTAFCASLFVWEQAGQVRLRHFNESQGSSLPLPVANAGVALTLCAGVLLRLFQLLFSEQGVVHGPGWVAANVTLPALFVTALSLVLVAVLPLSLRFRLLMTKQFGRWVKIGRPAIAAVATAWISLSGIVFVLLIVLPGLVQWLVVRPNEITFEKPFISHNIEFTRRGFDLEKVEVAQFKPSPVFTEDKITNNRHLLSEVRLWDWRALDAVYRQFQEIRLYYEFVDVDVDRYQIAGRARQLMISVRELAQSNLPEQSQTFVNQRFKYTHGYGYTAAAVSDFTKGGLPNLLVKDIPPVSSVPELDIQRPEIYYGELTNEPAIVNTKELEFDYPSGTTNVYTSYSGEGGVQLSSFWRKIIFGWKLDGSLLLFSGYPTSESRVMFDRQIVRRVEKLAPFLTFDEDPYAVVQNGRLYWIIDGYTSSKHYPYSQPFSTSSEGGRTLSKLDGVRYIRNSVKAVVDAYDGHVNFYAFDEKDTVLAAWMSAFPNLVKSKEALPEGLRAHIRYPYDFLLIQGLIYRQYHMSDPEVFYNQEDLWVRATEKHYADVVPIDPYYVMWELPDSDKVEFVLILPFTPKNKQVLIGWMAALSDGENYGRLLAYNLPKDTRMLGPQQVETKIDQDPFLSGQLTLWGQQGSEVIRGNVLAIPLDDSLIYVEPIYLKAETAAYPELRIVAVMHGDQLSYADNFDEALLGLLTTETGLRETATMELVVRKANDAFENYLRATGDEEFLNAATQLETLRDLLNLLLEKASVEASAEADDQKLNEEH